jgi:hypothetical protein
MVLRDVYTAREDVVGTFSVEYPKRALVNNVLKPIMRNKGLAEDIFKPAGKEDMADRIKHQYKAGDILTFRAGGRAKVLEVLPDGLSVLDLDRGDEGVITWDELGAIGRLGMVIEDIFKPASPEDLKKREYEKWQKGRPFPFLQHIDPEEVLAKGYGSVKGIPFDPQERSEIWIKHGVEVNIYYDEDVVAKDYLEVIPSMTKDYNESGKTAEEWIKTLPGALIEYSGYSGNEDPAYFWGGNFSYVVFNYDQAQYVIMDDKVMEGSFEDFWSTMTPGDSKSETAMLMGYDDSDYDLMVKDIEKWYESDGEIVKDPPDPNTDPMQMRFPFMDEPPARTD